MNRLDLRLFLLMSIIFVSIPLYGQKIKVACIGNSVTYGSGISNPDINSYPAQLQLILGTKYEVKNFGHSGATVLENGHKPYITKSEYSASKEFLPNIVVIHLGLNDQGMNNWPNHKEEFVSDYLNLINSYKALLSNPEVIICRMTPTFSGHHWFEEGMRESFKEVQTRIEEIGVLADIEVIDLHEPLYRFPEFFPDNIHPTKEGAKIIATKVASAITGRYGGLKLSVLYGEQMVFQRDKPIVISGMADEADEIIVSLAGFKEGTTTKANGTWQVVLPAMEAGGPYRLKFESKKSSDIIIDEVFIGEVWLASGQSNMAFETGKVKNANTVLKDSMNSKIHIFSLEGSPWPGRGAFGKEALESCNSKNYFNPSGWSKATEKGVRDFSAIAYSFAYNLQKELNMHIGIIDNSVGGSTTQSWISRESMEQQHETVNLLNDTHNNPMVQQWVNSRKVENFVNLKKLGIKARHPFDPTMLFDAGIQPIKDYGIKGVIWYQGESNAERPHLHSLLFEMLVNDWRKHFSNPELPFYFVQLSSINRSNWGAFRDSQRRLLSIPNTGMVVSSDVGHPSDVHPKKKWVIGTRLSKIALNKNYNKKIAYSGPLFDFVNIEKDKMIVHFKHGDGLTTKDENSVKDLYVAGADGIFIKADSRIEKDNLIVWSPKVSQPRYVKYGFSPFTNGNLINKYMLPASTFANKN